MFEHIAQKYGRLGCVTASHYLIQLSPISLLRLFCILFSKGILVSDFMKNVSESVSIVAERHK